MTPEQFCYWLQGKLETRNLNTIDEYELKSIQQHLQLVFKKVIPPVLVHESEYERLKKLFEEQQKQQRDKNPWQTGPISPYTVTC